MARVRTAKHFISDLLKVSPISRLVATPFRKIKKNFNNELDKKFINRRLKISCTAFNLKKGAHSAQLIRTQPMHYEKGAKECYANLTRQMLHYMFIQNQYIQYVTWAEHLIFCVGQLRAAGYLKPIYVFMLTSTPERAGMDYPTYEAASKVGSSETMKVEHEEAVNRARERKGNKPITPEEMQQQGIHVFMGGLWTCADISASSTIWPDPPVGQSKPQFSFTSWLPT